MKIKKCDVCGKYIKVDDWGNGVCKDCGWVDSEICLKNPDNVKYPNITSLNNARELIKSNKKLKPTFNEFITIVKENLEPSFRYKNKRYGNTSFDGYEFYECDSEKEYQSYKTIEDFEKHVNINGVLLKDLWKDVSDFELGC